MKEILVMRDKTDKYTTKKEDIFDLPMRLLVVGGSGMGKSSLALGNFLLRESFYKNDFEPENIFIFSGSLKGDLKLQEIISQLDIPKENCFDSYDDEIGNIIYDDMVEKFNQSLDDKERPNQSLFIFDDLGFSNLQNQTHKKNDIMNRIMSNGRKYLISTITLNQRITQLSRSVRENASGVILYRCSNRDFELIEGDFNQLKNKKEFREIFFKNTENKNDFFCINFSNGKNIYQNSHFEDILF